MSQTSIATFLLEETVRRKSSIKTAKDNFSASRAEIDWYQQVEDVIILLKGVMKATSSLHDFKTPSIPATDDAVHDSLPKEQENYKYLDQDSLKYLNVIVEDVLSALASPESDNPMFRSCLLRILALSIEMCSFTTVHQILAKLLNELRSTVDSTSVSPIHLFLDMTLIIFNVYSGLKVFGVLSAAVSCLTEALPYIFDTISPEIAMKLSMVFQIIRNKNDWFALANTVDLLSCFNQLIGDGWNKDADSERFLILCSVFEMMVKEDIFMKESWLLDCLLEGICHAESSIRKQTSFMMKTVLDAYDKGLLAECAHKLWKFDSTTPDKVLAVWSDYLLLFDSLYEKQVHLIKPNFHKVRNICQGVREGILDIRWLVVLFKQFLSHDSNVIRVWGLVTFFSLDHCSFIDFVCEEGPIKALYQDFITLSCRSALFSFKTEDESSDDMPDIFTAMVHYLNSVSQMVCKSEPYKRKFLHGLMETLVSNPWSPVPCLYWTAALAKLDKPEFRGGWDHETIALINRAISTGCSLTEKRIKLATEFNLLRAILNLCEANSIENVLAFGKIINALRTDSVIIPGTGLWHRISLFMDTAVRTGTITRKALLKTDFKEEAGVMLNLKPDNDFCLSDWLREVCLSDIIGCSDRLYINQGNIVNALQCFNQVSSICCYNTLPEKEDILGVMLEVVDALWPYLLTLVKQVGGSARDIKVYKQFVSLVKSHLPDQLMALIQPLIDIPTDHKLQSDLYWELLTIFLESDIEMMNTNTRYKQLHIDCVRRIRQLSTYSSNVRLSSAQLVCHWTAAYYYLAREQTAEDGCLWYNEAVEALSIMYQGDYIVVFKALVFILPMMKDLDEGNTASIFLQKVDEDCKNSHYLPAIAALCESVFSVELIFDESKTTFLTEVFEGLIAKAEDRPGVANAVCKQIVSTLRHVHTFTSSLPEWLIRSVVKLGVFGPVHNKAQRSFEEVFEFLEGNGDYRENKLWNEHRVGYDLSDHQVRVWMLDFIGNQTQTVGPVFEEACKQYGELLAVKCYSNFPNSLVHRLRHRLLCLLLSLLPQFIKEGKLIEFLINFLTESLRKELQPSCRHQLEWMFIYCLKQHPAYIKEYFITSMVSDKMVREKASYVCSMFSVAAHICIPVENAFNCTKDRLSDQLDIVSKLIPLIVPWGMSSKFHMRIHSQAALMKIWHHAGEAGILNTLSERFPLLKANMEFALQSGTATEKNSRKLLENFFYFKFDSLKDWSGELIFTLWPRLLGLSPQESINYKLFSGPLRTQCYNSVLRTCDPTAWNIKVKEGDNETEHTGSEVQKKVITWRTMNPAALLSEMQLKDLSKPGLPDECLIVVTSLIDRPPNLGGLCRTAEIFGAHELVVSSLKVTEDPSFLSTSVTAHQWITIKQVPAHCLAVYLTEMKSYGFTVIGVEQTTNSKSLARYKMPPKTLLLLGNEKEGISAELMYLVDVCVEIPQQGIIRSLNVHVAGALMIWEYRKQRLLELNL